MFILPSEIASVIVAMWVLAWLFKAVAIAIVSIGAGVIGARVHGRERCPQRTEERMNWRRPGPCNAC